MRKCKNLVLPVVVALGLVISPVSAAGAVKGSTDVVKREWMNMEKGPGAAVWMENGAAAGQAQLPDQEPGVPVEEPGMPSQASEVGQVSQGQMPEGEQVSQEQAPGTEHVSQVLEVGQGGVWQSEEARLAAEQEAARQAEEAARQAEEQARQAEEAARLAEEQARQAKEAEARLAAEEQARRAAEEAAVRQSSGRVVDPSKPMVALTFDDGPQSSVGNRIMDCLARYGGKATFFMVGDRVTSHKTEVQRMVAEGHEIANHTMNHKYLQKQGAGEIQAQVNRCNDILESVCGVRPTIMRLPGGNYNSTVLANTHMPMIQWNIDTLDWKTRNAQQTVNAVLGKVKDGDVVLMHELYGPTGDAALQIIPALVSQGYQLVTVSEMAAAKGYKLEAGKLYSSFK